MATIISGGEHSDSRGTLSYWNDFDMSPIKRFYIISHPSTDIIRGWRGHKIEQRWFCVADGEFLIRLVEIDNWATPSPELPIDEFIITNTRSEVLHIPAGFASSIQALKENSRLIVFANFDVKHASKDDYLYPLDYFRK
jgi:dTDP-4-dehydrorhamnose 3,5-epimerase-like enzyme